MKFHSLNQFVAIDRQVLCRKQVKYFLVASFYVTFNLFYVFTIMTVKCQSKQLLKACYKQEICFSLCIK